MKNFKVMSLALGLTAGVAMMNSCSNDVYDPTYAQKLVESEYKANFEKTFGAVAPDQSWDFAPGSEYYLEGESKARATRGTTAYEPVVGDYYEVQSSTLSWLTNKLKESSDNRKLGTPFAMTVPSNSFTIIPIYQGQAGMTWDLHMVVGTGPDAVDTKIWTKSQGIQTKTKASGNWTNLTTAGNTINAAAVRSLQYTFDNMPVGETIYFYLEVTSGSSGWATKGTKQSSLSGMMLALDCERPTNIDEKNEVMIIGCEDANLTRSDWDMNDIVFLVVGNPEVPKPIEISDMKVVEHKEKRYMIEDLGNTDDFDFNDVVVDAVAERTVTYTLVNGMIDYNKTIYGDWTQKATIKHVGGSLPFTLKIGDTVIDDIQPDYKDLNEVRLINGWNPDANNISVKVNNTTNNAIYNIDFPKPGSAPLIIATGVKQAWMPERVKIDWLDEVLGTE